ncbi:3-deoxy-D-manno-octulosonic acid transferase [Rhodoferax aquaticus]|uniref:3-deoxy-D-manno-octulosonic acid transferase n=2 Tax=Rhodoferax aquaticus TaxID=2527691 RepID=A0A515EVM9_9BURK|nr:3-deoxy-D-manno-octulosonic acid transferase [Rhodoferax aquaticus]QDL56706.1 3-deoxy-D-manno-octulosonic acid transferase [Rhodoferax aquaticus]
MTRYAASWAERVTLWAYGLVMSAAQPLLARKLSKRALAEPLYGRNIAQRWGYYADPIDSSPSASGSAYVWVHAVSLGETRAAAVLVGQLRERIPGMRLLLTHGTATGLAQGQSLLQEGDRQVWQPWDSPKAVARFLANFQPQMGVLMETEVWPNLIAACAQANVPLYLVNARLNEKSYSQALRFAWLARPAYAALAGVWAQSADDAQRLASLGAAVQAVEGNFKYDATPDATQLARGRTWRLGHKPVLMFASSREGEEQMLLSVLEENVSNTPMDKAHLAIKKIACLGVQLLIVPRHPQRFEAVAQLFEAAGLRVSRRSTWTQAPAEADVWIGDSVGEMALYFGLAQVALLGGSFAPLGGQNLIEAAACGCPVVMGPHTFNFAEAAEVSLAAGSAFRAEHLQDAVHLASDLLHHADRLEQSTQAALALCHAHQGAAARTANALSARLLH